MCHKCINVDEWDIDKIRLRWSRYLKWWFIRLVSATKGTCVIQIISSSILLICLTWYFSYSGRDIVNKMILIKSFATSCIRPCWNPIFFKEKMLFLTSDTDRDTQSSTHSVSLINTDFLSLYYLAEEIKILVIRYTFSYDEIPLIKFIDHDK